MLTFIVNPAAGSGYALKIEAQLKAALEQRGIQAEFLRTEQPGHATQLSHAAAQRESCSGVVAVGGDGTAYEVACGLMGTSVPLGIIPAGTGNDFIKTVGIPKNRWRRWNSSSQTKPARSMWAASTIVFS